MIVAILIEVIGQLSYRLGTPHCEADLLIYWMLMLLNILLNVNGILNSILLLPLVLNALTRHHDGCRGCPHKLGRHGPGAWIWWRVSCFLKLARRMPGIIWYYQVDSTMEVGLLIFWGKSCRINRFDRWNKFGGNIWNLHLRHENWHKLWYIQVIMATYHIQYTKFTQNDIPSQRGNPGPGRCCKPRCRAPSATPARCCGWCCWGRGSTRCWRRWQWCCWRAVQQVGRCFSGLQPLKKLGSFTSELRNCGWFVLDDSGGW